MKILINLFAINKYTWCICGWYWVRIDWSSFLSLTTQVYLLDWQLWLFLLVCTVGESILMVSKTYQEPIIKVSQEIQQSQKVELSTLEFLSSPTKSSKRQQTILIKLESLEKEALGLFTMVREFLNPFVLEGFDQFSMRYMCPGQIYFYLVCFVIVVYARF